MSINCIECDKELAEVHDTTYSNVTTHRCNVGDHTGNIYKCDDCDILIIDDFLNHDIYEWIF
jgi:phage FluMu protein Com